MPEAARDRPEEQVFFDDPAIDALLGVVMALAMEHYVLRDRLRAMEEQLVRAGQVDRSALAAAPASAGADDQRDAAAFVEDLLRPILGIQEASGAGGRFSLKRKA
ncbi:MAG TPA: hypothetical protein VHE11_07765 [Steroidobacteraceae bacterium]|nr:hypothetical protein [Steroidobacteraceae bacterium]